MLRPLTAHPQCPQALPDPGPFHRSPHTKTRAALLIPGRLLSRVVPDTDEATPGGGRGAAGGEFLTKASEVDTGEKSLL